MAASTKAEADALFRKAKYGEAATKYGLAIKQDPENEKLYGNRAACWMMLGKFGRAAEDCAEGLRREVGGELGKLRLRQAALHSVTQRYIALHSVTHGVT